MSHIFNIPKKVKENNYSYFDWLLTVVNYACPNSRVRIDMIDSGYNVTIFPANPDFRQSIIDNVLEIHRRFKMKITYSKSLKISKNVSYHLEIQKT